MGLRQGLRNLTNGYERKLTNSELSRGYFFVSMDREIVKLKELQVSVNGEKIGNKKIDCSGRISVGQETTASMKNKKIHLKIVGAVLNINF
jgi:hypothetical protein